MLEVINLASKKIVLKREIESDRYECLATIRVKEDRPYIATVLKLGLNKESLTEEIIGETLLPKESPAMSANILKRYKELGFVDSTGKLSELGTKAVNGDIYMPQAGSYYIDVTSDPLIENNFLQISSSSDKKNKNNGADKNENEDEEFVKAPDILLRCNGKLSLVWFNGEVKPVMIENIKDKVRLITRKIKYESEVTVELQGSEIKLKREQLEMTYQKQDVIEVKKVWNSFIKSHNLKWRGEPLSQGHCLVTYDETDNNQRISFNKQIAKSELEIEHLGKFKIDAVEINIQPYSEKDASKWLFDLIQNAMKDYVDEKRFMVICEEARKKITTYKPTVPNMRDYMDYLYDKAKNSNQQIPAEFWYIRAPMDLSIEAF